MAAEHSLQPWARCRRTRAARRGRPRRTPRWPRCRPPARCRRARPAAPRQRDRRERLVVEREELPGLRPRPVDRRRRVGHPVGPGQAERDRDQHGRRAGLDQRRAVDELDHRVHDAGRVHHDLDPVERDAEEQVRLDHLEPLVDQGRGVDGDHRAHVPGRVGQRLLGRDVGAARSRVRPRNGPPLAVSTSRRTSSARPPRRHCASALCSESTGTIWPGLARLGDQRAADDQRLLVGQREGVAGVERGQRRPQPDRAGDAVEHDVARPRRRPRSRPPPRARRTPGANSATCASKSSGLRPAGGQRRRPGTGPGWRAPGRAPGCRSTRSSRGSRRHVGSSPAPSSQYSDPATRSGAPGRSADRFDGTHRLPTIRRRDGAVHAVRYRP